MESNGKRPNAREARNFLNSSAGILALSVQQLTRPETGQRKNIRMRTPTFEQRNNKAETLPIGTKVLLKEDEDGSFSLYLATENGYPSGDSLVRSTHPSELLEFAKTKQFEVVPEAVPATA